MGAGVVGTVVGDDAGIAGLAGSVKDPVVHGLHHSVLIDHFVEAASGVGAGVVGVGVGHLSEGILGGLAGLPLGIEGFSLGLGGGDLLVGVSAVGVGVLSVDEDVAEVYGGIGVVVAVQEHHNVAGAVLGLDGGGITGLAGGIQKPLAVSGGEAVAGVDQRGGLGALVVLVHVGVEGFLVGAVHGLGDGVHVQRTVRGGDVSVSDHVQLAGMLGVVGVKLGGGVFIAVVDGLGVGGSNVVAVELRLQHLHGDALAVAHVDILLQAGVAVEGPFRLEALHSLGVHGFVFLGENEAGLLGGLVQELDLSHGVHGGLQEIVTPGHAVHIILIAQRLGGIKEHAGGHVIIVRVIEVHVAGGVVVVQLRGGVILTVDGHGGDMTGSPGGVQDQKDGQDQNNASADDGVFDVGFAAVCGGLGLCGGALVHAGFQLFFTDFLVF